MLTIKTSLPNFLTEATQTINNAIQNQAIADALNQLGFDLPTLQQGQELLNTARQLYDDQIKEYGEQHAATETFTQATKQADKTYAKHRKIAKIAFKNDPQRQTDLHLNTRKPRAFNPWYQQARHFYTALLADTEAQTKLARYKITLENLQAAQAQIEQTLTLSNTKEQEKSEAQQATQQRDAAIEALDEWLSEFKAIARIALEDNPQLLEALNLGPIP